MELIYYTAAFASGDLSQMELPLEDVTLSSGITSPGELSATLDLRACVDRAAPLAEQHADAAAVLDLLKPGARTIALIRENLTTGDTGSVDKAMGEWLIDRIDVRHGDPVVRIHGVELAGYARHCVITRNWTLTNTDPVATFRQVMADMWTSGQPSTIQVDVGSGGSTAVARQDFKVVAGATTYESALQELASDQFEWRIVSTVQASGGVPTRMVRTLQLRAPLILTDRTADIAVEVVTPGTPGVTSAVDFAATIALEDQCYDLWAFGAGSGAKQVTARVQQTIPSGMPRLSRTWTSRRHLSQSSLTREARAVAARMDPAFEPFTVVADMGLMPGGGPRVGDRYWCARTPSLSMPTPETFTARVVSWQWTQPRPGERETVTLTMERR